jgi:hypothetical protein
MKPFDPVAEAAGFLEGHLQAVRNSAVPHLPLIARPLTRSVIVPQPFRIAGSAAAD